MSKDVKLTVWLSTYNQEPYVAQALDSILMQETTFDFDILAADECSTDGTQGIILEYQRRYPDRIRTYFTPVTVGGCQKLVDCIDKGLFYGDYIAPLEGDDYWLGKDRLQTLVDFLDANPQYSRVSHNRQIINERDEFTGYDTKPEILGNEVTMEGFLKGQLYSDFGSVYRNYYKQVGGKYNCLFLASRNVIDFQEMFITQDFGPVFVMDAVYGAYRSRNVQGATNYNSITSFTARRRENIHLARAVENFYNGRYDLSPMIRSNQLKMLQQAVTSRDSALLQETLDMMSTPDRNTVLPTAIYFLLRGKQVDSLKFLRKHLPMLQLPPAMAKMVCIAFRRMFEKFSGGHGNPNLRGYIRQE